MGKIFETKQVLRFLAGGGSAAAIDFAVYYLLLKAHLDVAAAKTVSYISGAAAGFVINKFWTFESRQFSKLEIFKYTVLYAASACLNAAVNQAVLSAADIRLAAFLCATGVSTIVNFLGQKFFVFAKRGSGS